MYFIYYKLKNDRHYTGSILLGVWKLCSKFPSLFNPEFLSKSLHYAQFYSVYTASSITIPHLQFKLPIIVSYVSLLVEPLKSICTYVTFINAFRVYP